MAWPKTPQKKLDSTIQRFKTLIETDNELYLLFQKGFGQVPEDEEFSRDALGLKRVDDLKSMISAMDSAIQQAPSWNSDFEQKGVLGCPLNEVLVWLSIMILRNSS